VSLLYVYIFKRALECRETKPTWFQKQHSTHAVWKTKCKLRNTD